MKKADLVDVVAQQKNLPRQQVEITVDALIEAVAEGLAKGERIDLRGFGAFAVRESAARKGRKPCRLRNMVRLSRFRPCARGHRTV